MEVIILAGGFGTRLGHIIQGIPKPMALINGKPFLEYIFEYLLQNSINKVVLAVGYKSNVIRDYFGNKYSDIQITYSVEETPLGTGGAIKKGLEFCKEEQVIIINGDTFFNVDLNKMYDFHKLKMSRLTLAAKSMNNFERYGSLIIEDHKVIRFEEKKKITFGNINGGVYIVQRELLCSVDQKEFSFEKLILEDETEDIYAFESNGYFIDIGVPEDYFRAQKEFENFKMKID